MKSSLIYIFLFISLIGCKNSSDQKNESSYLPEDLSLVPPVINYSHFDHLYKELNLPNGKHAAIIHIYSNYPDYSYDIEPKEGYTCVDDVARAIVLLSGTKGKEEQLIRLTEFLLYMQNENGWFNNFIRKDLAINTTYKTSIAQPDWWSWRALWAMEKAYPVIVNLQPELAERLTMAIDKLVNKTRIYLSQLAQMDKLVKGIPIATNLPYESATDQASILLIALNIHYQRTQDKSLEKLMRQLADGMLLMQVPSGMLKGMFLSWENVWHAYGNSQSYALLLTGKLLKENSYVESALREINFFYPYLKEREFFEWMTVESNNQSFNIISEKAFPQIAYGIRPIVYACIEAFSQTGDKKYKKYSEEWLSWFMGNNTASKVMYHQESGRCYDGIKSKEEINKNSGAESTIEALLSIQAYQTIN